MSDYPIKRNLVNHPPTDMESVRAMAHKFAAAIDYYCPQGREQSLAFTKLEEAVMWSIASIARESYDARERELQREYERQQREGVE